MTLSASLSPSADGASEAIAALWNKGQTRRQIGLRLGLTPGQVSYHLSCAKAKGLPLCVQDQRHNKAVTLVTGARAPVVPIPTAITRDAALPGVVPALFIGRRAMQCAWIVGPVDGDATLCCGDAVMDGKPYCAAHAGLAYQPRQKTIATRTGTAPVSLRRVPA